MAGKEAIKTITLETKFQHIETFFLEGDFQIFFHSLPCEGLWENC